jgi:hypothetical protein
VRVQLQLTDTVNLAYGKDHYFGYFAQVWTNGDHADDCECPQCEFDQPAVERDHLGAWRGVAAFVLEATGYDIMGHIVGVEPETQLASPEQYARLIDAPTDIFACTPDESAGIA